MSVDILGTIWDQCRSTVQYTFTSTETRRLIRTDSWGGPPRLSHSFWTMCCIQNCDQPFTCDSATSVFNWCKEFECVTGTEVTLCAWRNGKIHLIIANYPGLGFIFDVTLCGLRDVKILQLNNSAWTDQLNRGKKEEEIVKCNISLALLRGRCMTSFA